jgi:hypothetical protein
VAEDEIKDKYCADQVQIWSAEGSKVNGLHDAIVRITLPDNEKYSFMTRAGDDIVVEGGYRYKIRTPVRCSACQSNDHRAYKCEWRKILGRITFEIQAPEDTQIILRT